MYCRSDRERQQLPKLCSVKPEKRLTNIFNFLKQVLDGGLLNPFHMNINKKPLKVTGKQLKTPLLRTPQGKYKPDSSWIRKKIRFGGKETVIKTEFFVIYSIPDEMRVKEYMKKVTSEFRSIRSPVQIMRIQYVPVGDREKVARVLEKTKFIDSAFLIFFTNPKNNPHHFYDSVKRFAVGHGYLSQGIRTDHAFDPKREGAILTKIVTQIINKHGKLLWWMELSDVTPKLFKKDIVMIGIDVYHSPKRYLTDQNKYVSLPTVTIISLFSGST